MSAIGSLGYSSVMTTSLGPKSPQPILRRTSKTRRLFVSVVIGALAIAVICTAVAAWRAWAPANPDVVWRDAEAHLLAGRFDLARAGLRRLESLRRPTAEDWVLRAQIANAEERDPEALEALKFVADTQPLAAQAHYMAGRIERKHNRVRLAEAQYRRAVELDPKMVAAHRELIYIYGMQLRRHELDAEFKALGELTALNHHDMFTWGITHFAAWGPDSAQDLESFIAADPLDRDSRLALAAMLVDRPASAERAEQALAPLPASDPEAAALRIEIKLIQGEIDQATAMLGAAPQEGGRLASLRGRMALRNGDLTAALRYFEAAAFPRAV